MKRTIGISLLLSGVFFAAASFFIFGGDGTAVISGAPAISGEDYINERGEKWGPLPNGPQIFQVASAEGLWPKFIEGRIDPVKVFPGDTQTFRIVVQSPAGIKSVIAHIETDNGEVEVILKRTGTASVGDLIPPKYEVNGTSLNILTDQQIAERIKKELAKENDFLVNKAIAQTEGEKEIWEGEWIVSDTHNRNYQTVFTATDNNDRANSLTLAWSDPCSGINIFGNSTLSSNCTLGVGVVDGVESGNLTINGGVTLTLSGAGSIFAWNTGYSINLNANSQISIGSGAEQ